ncbi:MAG: sensor histidine kinase [Sporichthyaceae bacterium]
MGRTAEPPRNAAVRGPGASAELHELASVLHDGLSQELFAAELDLHELRCRTELPPDVRELVERIDLRLRAGSAQLRSALIGVLAPAPFGASGEQAPTLAPAEALAADVETMAQEFAGRHGIATALNVGGSGTSIEDRPARVLRRAVQEGLANVGKHAAASRVQLALHRGRRWWTVQIDDDGAGDPAHVRSSAAQIRSFGLSSLDTDIARVGGRLVIAEAPRLGGLRLHVAVPIGRPATP